MRLTRRLRNIAVALPALAAAAAIPSSTPAVSVPEHINAFSGEDTVPQANVIELVLSPENPQAVFKVPCAGCLGSEEEDDDALLFNFQAFPSQELCGVSNVTVNGQTLPQTWNGTHHLGQGSVRSISTSNLIPQRNLGLEWSSFCVTLGDHPNSGAQVFTTTIGSVDSRPVESTSGFTVSFRPTIPLELLRLSSVPDFTAAEQPHADLWRDPPAHLRLTASAQVNEESVESAETPFDVHLKEIGRLEAEEARIQERIQYHKALIAAHATSHPSSAKECNLKCFCVKFIDGAKATLKDIYMSIRPAFESFHGNSPQASLYSPSHSEETYPNDLIEVSSDAPLLPTPTNRNKAFPTRGATSTATVTADGFSSPGLSQSDTSSYNNETFEVRRNAFVITLKIVGVVTGLTCIFLLVRRSSCCDPRHQAERRAAQEQRRTEREYRHAARKHRLRTWWASWTGRLQDNQRITDYEEKRSLIIQQENILESAMQEEIRLLRSAHNVVNDIVNSPRMSHARTAPIPIMTQYPHYRRETIYDAETWAEVPLSRTPSLPDYRSEAESSQVGTEPPAYSDDESDIVVDGFRGYHPRTRRSTLSDDSDSEPSSPVEGQRRRWSPGSSVISTSPRPSAETMRHMFPHQRP